MELLSVDPAPKSIRRYCLTVQYRVDRGAELFVTWGRIGLHAGGSRPSIPSANSNAGTKLFSRADGAMDTTKSPGRVPDAAQSSTTAAF